MRRWLVLSAGLLTVASSAMAHPITFDDLYGVARAGDAAVSPDGRRIVYVLTTTDLEQNARASHLWLMGADGTGDVQLTYGEDGESSPVWSADGEWVYFASGRENGNQVWRLPMAGGEARRVTDAVGGIGAYTLAPDDKVLYVSRVDPECESDSCQRARIADNRAHPNRPRLYEQLPVRLYSRLADDLINRVYAVDPDGSHRIAVTDGPVSAPAMYQAGYQDFAMAPDGEYCVSMSVDSMPMVRTNTDLYVQGVNETEFRRLTDNPALDGTPRYSPDGRYLACLSTSQPGYESDQWDLILYDRQAGSHRNLTADFDRSVSEYVWGPKSQVIYLLVVSHGHEELWQLTVANGKLKRLLADAVYNGLAVAPTGRFIVLSRTLPDWPSELYRYDLGSGQLTRLTHVTEPVTSDVDFSRWEEFWYPGMRGDSIHATLTFPPNFDAAKQYPLVLLIHGGPQWAWLNDFNYYGWNTQLVAAQGYIVAQFDPHGSLGYGLKFKEQVSKDWGGTDFHDLMMGIDYVLAHYPMVDSTRMAAVGRSYGGFMVNWINGHSDRFQCLIGIDGTSNSTSFYGSTDELWFPEWDVGGTPWDNPEEYKRSSPITYAENFSTPMMLIHGKNDYRVDLSEGLQMFTTLQRRGIPSQFLLLPNEGHNAHRLENLRVIYDEQFKWLARWLR